MADPVDVVARGKDTDLVTYFLLQTIGALPSVVFLAGMHFETLGIRALRTDSQGRLFVSPSTSYFTVLNNPLTDTYQSVIIGAPTFRRIVFYAYNANAVLQFQLSDLTLTPPLVVVPNVPLTVEGIFVNVNARNAVAGVISNLQAVVGQDPTI